MTSSVSRSAVPQIRLRSLSPLDEPDANKRSAVICDFFAKGWCIKGNACKFLHIKEDVSITSQKCEEGVPASSVKSGLQDGGGKISYSCYLDVQQFFCE